MFKSLCNCRSRCKDSVHFRTESLHEFVPEFSSCKLPQVSADAESAVMLRCCDMILIRYCSSCLYNGPLRGASSNIHEDSFKLFVQLWTFPTSRALMRLRRPYAGDWAWIILGWAEKTYHVHSANRSASLGPFSSFPILRTYPHRCHCKNSLSCRTCPTSKFAFQGHPTFFQSRFKFANSRTASHGTLNPRSCSLAPYPEFPTICRIVSKQQSGKSML